MEDTYSPLVHRIQQTLRWRAVHHTDPLPPPYEILLKYSNPPDELVKKAQSALSSTIKAADVKRVPPKQKGRKRDRDGEKPLSGLDVEQLLGREKRIKISAENAIPEFKQLLATTENSDAIQQASKQMEAIIENYIQYSTGDSGYGRAVEAIRVMREELNDFEEPGLYNEFIRQLKKKILDGDLGGERREMWWRVRSNRLGLLDKKSNPLSDVSEEDAKNVRIITRCRATYSADPMRSSSLHGEDIMIQSNTVEDAALLPYLSKAVARSVCTAGAVCTAATANEKMRSKNHQCDRTTEQ